jgi:hypothetical protein
MKKAACAGSWIPFALGAKRLAAFNEASSRGSSVVADRLKLSAEPDGFGFY